MAYTLADSIIGAQAIGDISTTKKNTLGQIVKIQDASSGWIGAAMYVAFPAGSAVPAGSLLSFQSTDATPTRSAYQMLTAQTWMAASGYPLFVSLTVVPNSASVQYGWVLVEGVAPTLKTAIKPISSDLVYLSATAGRIYVTGTSIARKVVGARFIQSSVTTTTSLVNIFYNRAHLEGALT